MQLVKTAEKKLFSLKGKLNERYDTMDANNFLQKIIGEPRQLKMEGIDSESEVIVAITTGA